MPSFDCQTCGETFEVPPAVLARYPGWSPRFCRAHSRSARSSGSGGAGDGTRRRGGRGTSRGRSRGSSRGGSSGGSTREELLTPAEVLERYSGGPASGVFTDGSASPNPGPGGWGFVHVEDGVVLGEGHGHEARTTNNRMELQALIEAYSRLPEDAEVTIYSDSRLCVDTITKWAAGWERRGWKRKGGEIKNLELVQELYALHRARPGCLLQWIAAHDGARWNEYADSLATTWLREQRSRSSPSGDA